MKLEPIILSLLDTDLYKFNMDQVIFHKHTNLVGEYHFKCRNEGVVFTPEMLQEYQKVQNEVGAALGRLIAIAEAYPDLKANENFMALQSQLEGTENRIAVERQKFNETARGYNTVIRQFPKNIVAGMFGFEKKPYFEAQEGAQQAPEVKF